MCQDPKQILTLANYHLRHEVDEYAGKGCPERKAERQESAPALVVFKPPLPASVAMYHHPHWVFTPSPVALLIEWPH